MESYLLVLASLILLVPSVLYLPIGMTMKGKMSILLTAIIVTFVGLYASTTIDYWVMLCLLLVLIIMITIVIRERFADMIFSTVKDEEVSPQVELGATGEQIEAEPSVHVIHSEKYPNLNTEKFNQAMAEVAESEPSFTETPQAAELNRIDIFSVESDLEVVPDEEEDYVSVLDFEEAEVKNILESEPKPDVEKVDEILDEDQVAFLNDRESLWENDIDIHHEENDIDEKPGHMSDIEKWIEEEESGSIEDLLTQAEGLEGDNNLSEDVNTHQDDVNKQVEQEAMAEIEKLVEEIDDDEMVINHYPNAEPEDDKQVEDNPNHSIAIDDDLEELYLADDSTDKQIKTVQETESENLEIRNDTISTEEEAPVMDMVQTDDIDPTISEAVDLTDEANDNSYLQNQIFNSMLDQLYLAKEELTEDEYEKLIRSHLTESLPSSVYYTFANLLVDHYIANGKWNELSKVLTDLAKKYEQYPILREQLEYLYQQYCK